MGKQKVLKIITLSGLIDILFIGSAFGAYKYSQQKNFNNLVNLASQKLYSGDYDTAIKLYNQALSYKNDNNVQQEIALEQSYKQYSGIYNEGLKLMTEKKYSEAIQKLSEINQASGQLYTNAQGKIEECKKNIISDNIQNANTAISNKEYDSASKYIAEILKMDSNNTEAKNLKDKIAKLKISNAEAKKIEVTETDNREIESTGSMKGVVTWQYNKVIGTRPDTGANICLISKNASKNSNDKVFAITLVQHPNGQDGIYTAKADGYGNYEIDSIPVGQYYLLIKSNNTNSDMTIDSYTFSILQGIFQGEEWNILQNTLKLNKYTFEEVEIKANKTIIKSHDFGYTYF